jgi:hypothetical protein
MRIGKATAGRRSNRILISKLIHLHAKASLGGKAALTLGFIGYQIPVNIRLRGWLNMKLRLASLSLLALHLILMVVPVAAQGIYNNGPINGNTDAWTINFGFIVGDSFTVSTGNTTLTGLSFGAWLFPGDTLESAEVWITNAPLGGTSYFDQVVSLTQSGCAVNQYGFDVCTEFGTFNGPNLANGTYWVNLENAVVNDGDPVYWDENSGVGCTSPGCPSQAEGNNCIPGTHGGYSCIPSESFSLYGDVSGTTVPEPGSVVLFGSGFVGMVGVLRRKLF